MKFHQRVILITITIAVAFCIQKAWAESPISERISYQGFLQDASGKPANGLYDFWFAIFNDPTSWDPSARIGDITYYSNILVTDGIFTSNFPVAPGAFSQGYKRWIQIGVRPAGQGDHQTLNPRQELFPTPYSFWAANCGGIANSWLSTASGSTLAITNGQITLSSASGLRSKFFIGSNNDGIAEFYGPNGNLNVRIAGSYNNLNRGLVSTANEDGNTIAEFGALDNSAGEGGLRLYSKEGNVNVELSSNPDHPQYGYLHVADDANRAQGVLTVNNDGIGALTLWGSNDTVNIDLGSTDNSTKRGFVGVANSEGKFVGQLFSEQSDEGVLALYGPNQSGNVYLGAYGESKSEVNFGFIGVADKDENMRAQMGVYPSTSRGFVQADFKSFVVDYPGRMGEKIIYISLEGAEAGIYHRGTVMLIDGRATIELPDHFLALALPGSITVQLTPASLSSMGIGFEIKTNPEGKSFIEIGELMGGRGNYEVHFNIQAAREAPEGYRPVVNQAASLQNAKDGNSKNHGLIPELSTRFSSLERQVERQRNK